MNLRATSRISSSRFLMGLGTGGLDTDLSSSFSTSFPESTAITALLVEAQRLGMGKEIEARDESKRPSRPRGARKSANLACYDWSPTRYQVADTSSGIDAGISDKLLLVVFNINKPLFTFYMVLYKENNENHMRN